MDAMPPLETRGAVAAPDVCEPPVFPIPTVAVLLSRYAAEYLLYQAPTTQQTKRSVFLEILESLGDLPLPALTPDVLRAWRDQLLRRLTPASVNTYMQIMSGVLTVAVRDYDWLPASPLVKVRKPTPDNSRARFLSADEQSRLLAACRQSACPMLLPVVLVALTTGARKMEILMRRWADMDLDRGLMRLEQTKNGQKRAVPLPQKTGAVLRAWQAKQLPASPWVFPGEQSRAVPARLGRPWQRAVAAAGLVDFHFHDLRHTAASYLAMSGVSIEDIAVILGHRSLKTTQRYRHLSSSYVARLVQTMTEQFIVFPPDAHSD